MRQSCHHLCFQFPILRLIQKHCQGRSEFDKKEGIEWFIQNRTYHFWNIMHLTQQMIYRLTIIMITEVLDMTLASTQSLYIMYRMRQQRTQISRPTSSLGVINNP